MATLRWMLFAVAVVCSCIVVPRCAQAQFIQTGPAKVADARDPKTGFMPVELTFADARAETLDKDNNLVRPTTTAKPQPIADGKWKCDGVTIEVQRENGGALKVTVTNSEHSELTQIDFQLPQIVLPGKIDDWRIATGSRGGVDGPLAVGQGNTGGWPGYCFSPLVSLYRATDQATLGLTWFTPDLSESTCYWFCGSNPDSVWFNPCLRLSLAVPGGGSTTFIWRTVSYASAADHWKDYRESILIPFLKSRLGNDFQPRKYKAPGTWAMRNFTRNLVADVSASVASGKTGYIQWPPADGTMYYYAPDPFNLPWVRDLKAAAEVPGLASFGVVINPFIGPTMLSNPLHGEGKYKFTNLNTNPRALNVRQYHKRLIAWLKERKITSAFWDTGTNATSKTGTLMRPGDYLQLLKDFADADITVLPENGGDVAAMVSGAWLQFQYQGNDPIVAKVVDAEGQPFALNQDPLTVNGTTWDADARAKGYCPIINLERQR